MKFWGEPPFSVFCVARCVQESNKCSVKRLMYSCDPVIVFNVNWPQYEVITIQLQIFGAVCVLIVISWEGSRVPRKRMFGLCVLKKATDGSRMNAEMGNRQYMGEIGDFCEISYFPRKILPKKWFFFAANFQILRPAGVCAKENCFRAVSLRSTINWQLCKELRFVWPIIPK